VKRWAWVIAGLGLVAALVAALGLNPGGQPEPRPSRVWDTVQIARERLVSYVTVDGEVGFGPAQPFATRAEGTITWLAPVNTTVERGRPLLRVDDKPVILLYGPLPMYRVLAETLVGQDVAQLEQNLKQLGYTGFTVDTTFSASTTAAVKRWQRDSGLSETGLVELGQVAFLEGAVRVVSHTARLGALAAGDVLTYSGTTKLVTARTAAGKAGWARPETKTVILYPNGATAEGRVRQVEAAAPSGADQGPQVQIIIALSEPAANAEPGPVKVRYAEQERADVLTVPVGALLALAEGGYGIELDDGRIVAVQTGLFAEGKVEIQGGGLDAGTKVRLPK
jgi:putative peptidoglycan binding protein